MAAAIVRTPPFSVMPALVAGIHAAPLRGLSALAQSPGVDGRDKPGHDAEALAVRAPLTPP